MLTRCQFFRTSSWSRSFSSGRLGSRREYATTESSSTSNIPDNGSIFSKPASAWDHIFSDVAEMPPLLPTRPSNQNPVNASSPRTRRQAMTAREINAFDEMFHLIFNAVSDQKAGSIPEVGIGRAPTKTGSHVNDFLSKMRGHSKRVKWSEQANEELDRKKEEMLLCDTDHQLLEWAMREVFGESKRYEEIAQEAIKAVVAGKELETMPQLQPAIYPHLVANLIRTFRDKYRDPHLALSMFDHARHLSIPSYVFGCTTPAYNELIETRWRCFRDLKGVHDALEEMTVNGVDANNQTRKLLEEVRRQVGERNNWEEEAELGSGEVWMMLNKIEHLIGRHGKEHWTIHGQRRQNPSDEAWKKAALDPEKSGDGWEFGKWGYRGEEPRRSWNGRSDGPPPREHERRNRHREEPRQSWNERWHDPPITRASPVR